MEKATTARTVHVQCPQLATNIGCGNPQGHESVGIEIDADFAVHPANAAGHSNAGHFEHGARNLVIDKPTDVSLAHAIREDSINQHPATGVLGAGDDRFSDSGGHLGADGRYRVAHIVDGAVHILTHFEFDNGV